MIEPNFDLLLWIILVSLVINGICKIILGIAGKEKSQRYDVIDALDGVLCIVLVAWVVVG